MQRGAPVTFHDALQEVEIAFRQLEFTIKLLSFCELDHINPSDFDTDHIVLLEQGNLHFPTGHFSDVDNVHRATAVCVSVAFSASALALDQAFEKAGIKPDPQASDKLGQLRVLVHMIRCAHAHGIADPQWKATRHYCRELNFALDGVSVLLDLKALNGRLASSSKSAAIVTGI
jgi:hypothetical protein